MCVCVCVCLVTWMFKDIHVRRGNQGFSARRPIVDVDDMESSSLVHAGEGFCLRKVIRLYV